MAGRPKGLVKTGGRQKGTPNKNTPEKKEQVASFFHALLDDEVESKFWRYFMSGYVVDFLPDGRQQIVQLPINPVTFQAFKRAVEYKRGMPVQPISGPNGGAIPVQIITNMSLRDA